MTELRRNMSQDLLIYVVGAKVDLAQTKRAVDLETARETIADWVYAAEADSPPYPARPRHTHQMQLHHLVCGLGL